MNREMPEEETVTFDGRTVPVRVWESEVMLRCAAWVSIVQSTAIAYLSLFTSRYGLAPVGWWPVGVTLGLMLLGVFLLGSWFLRCVLIAVGTWFYLMWTATLGRWELPGRFLEASPLIPALLALAAAVRLFYRSPLARDGLMLLSAGWIACAFPLRFFRISNQGLMYQDYRGLSVVMGTLPIWCIVGPSVFVVAVLAGRPGRMLFSTPREARALALIRTIWTLHASARAWASLGMILLTLLGVTLGSEAIQFALRASDYHGY